MTEETKRAGAAWPTGLLDRVKAAEQRIRDNHAPRRIPADPTDVDLVLAEVRMLLEGKPAPSWLAAIDAHLSDPRCEGCDLPNGCPEYCWCEPDALQAAQPVGEVYSVHAGKDETYVTVKLLQSSDDYSELKVKEGDKLYATPPAAGEQAAAQAVDFDSNAIDQAVKFAKTGDRTFAEVAKARHHQAMSNVRLTATPPAGERSPDAQRASGTVPPYQLGAAWHKFAGCAWTECKGCAIHPHTADLVARFASALEQKLAAAERKYGYSDGWRSDDWEAECRAHLVEHIAKGDPRDVAAYCAFMWHHGWSTAGERSTPAEPSDIEFRLRMARMMAELHGEGVLSEQQCARYMRIDLVSWRKLERCFSAGSSFVEVGGEAFPTEDSETVLRAALAAAAQAKGAEQ